VRGSAVEIHIGCDVHHLGLVLNNVLGPLDRMRIDNKLSRDKLYGQTIKVSSGRGIDQSIPLAGIIVQLDDVKPVVSNSWPKTGGVPGLMILRIAMRVNGTQ